MSANAKPFFYHTKNQSSLRYVLAGSIQAIGGNIANNKNERLGDLAEEFVRRKCDEAGIILNYHSDACDFVSANGKYVEVKSAQISRLWQQNTRNRIGSFAFLREKSRETLIERDAYVGFVVRWEKELLLLGFVPARLLKLHSRMWVSIHAVCELKPLQVDEMKKILCQP